MTEALRIKLENLPDSPGCYIMKSGGEILYVGKAKNLKNRVRQYFQSAKNHTPKVRAMVERVDDLDTVLVDGELEALLLECNLIKRHRPFYNILLKDDKQFPYLAIDLSQDFPEVTVRRKIQSDGARYFGPYPGATLVREMLDAVRLIFPIRICKKRLREGMNMRPCIHHEIGQCLAPCAGLISRDDYHALIAQVIAFLSGQYAQVLDELKTRMQQAAASMNYERAAIYRDRIFAVEQVMQKQKASSTRDVDQDVLAFAPMGADALVSALAVRGGRLIGIEHYTLPRAGDEEAALVLYQFISQHYTAPEAIPQTILAPVPPADMETLSRHLSGIKGRKVVLAVPERGEKKKLVEMAIKNNLDEAALRVRRRQRSYARTTGALRELAQALGLPGPPRRIEGYDISNTQGAQSVGAMVVMLDGVLAPKEYRHFRIKTVEGANDFASMGEIISRRFAHGLAERTQREGQGLAPQGGKFSDLPDLVLIDGGRGQLNSALRAMREAGADVRMFGLAERIDEIVLPDADDTLLLDRHSNALHLVQRLRDEAHRFGIARHRKLRAKQSTASSLDGIPGIGAKKKRALLRQFKSIEALKNAPEAALTAADGIGPALAKVIYNHFHPEKGGTDHEV
jgi:excinuclease ABC subunit C